MITINLSGRLGNQMFQYALCRTIAEKRNLEFHIPRERNDWHQNISEYFNVDMGVEDCNTFYIYGEDSRQTYNPNIFNIPDYTKIGGYHQSEKYFVDNRETIKEWFKLEIGKDVNFILNKYPVDQYCYIHFRGTDYSGGDIFLPKSYYDEAIKYIKNLNDSLNFLIITDDVDLAKSFFDFDVISNDMMTDFKLLYSSKYCIIPNSTFSWWASWLSEDQFTIAPKFWFNYNRPEFGWLPADIRSERFNYI